MRAFGAASASLILGLTLACGPAASGTPPLEPASKKEASKAVRDPRKLAALNERERALVGELEKSVEHLSKKIGERNADKKWELADAADWLAGELEAEGFALERQGYEAAGIAAQNLIVEVPGREAKNQLVVIGAHYDSAAGSPGADDNASGVAAVLALAKRFRKTRPARTLKFAFFSLEEPPHFQTASMGSLVYSRTSAQRGEKILSMLSIESIGYYSNEPGSQRYPQALAAGHPTIGNFVAVIGNPESSALVDGVVDSLRANASLPAEGATMAEDVGGWSDHWSFWQTGVQAAMVTDTAPFRNPHYHRATDTADKLDFERMARVVAGLEHVIADLVGVRRAGDRS